MNPINYQVDQNSDTQTLLKNLRSLRSFQGNDEAFYEAYIKQVMHLLKSPCALIIEVENRSVHCLQVQCSDDSWQDKTEECLDMANRLVSRAEKQSFAYEKIAQDGVSSFPLMGVLFQLHINTPSNPSKHFMFLVLTHENKRQFNDLLLRFSLLTDVGAQRFDSSTPVIQQTPIQSDSQEILRHIIELVGMINDQEKFWLATSVLVNELSNRFHCDKVSIGWKQGGYILPKAISHIESFAKNTPAVHALENLYEESYEQDAEIYVPASSQGMIDHAHEKYRINHSLKSLLSLPLRYQGEVVAVVTLEKVNDEFSEQDIHGLRLLLNKITTPLTRLHDTDRNLFIRTGVRLKSYASWWLGVEHTLTKLTVIILFTGLAYLFLGNWHYKIEATMQLATNDLAYVAAPYDGVIDEVQANSGDSVNKGDLLLSFNQDELLLSEVEAIAEIAKFQSESEKFRASKKLADMEISIARKKQAQAKLERTRYYLKQARLTAPMSGVVIEGDKEKLKGAPVNKGDILFQISQSRHIFARLKVLQQDIDLIRPGHQGEFVLLSNPDKKYPFVVEKIIPVAQVDNAEGNVFSVEARIVGKPDSWWYPGISGIAKLDVGEKKVYWVLTHRLVDFFRIFFWV